MVKAYKVIDKITKRLIRDYHPKSIILFGSYAYGEPDKDSDIDILVISKTPFSFYKRLAEIRRLISDLRKGYPLEPIVLTPDEVKKRLRAGDQFIEGIMKEGKVLYAE